ncbi:MAG: glycosyltransferase [Spirochaetia bacterium]
MKGATAVLLVNSLGTGGAEKAVSSAARRLRLQGHDLRIVCLERPRERYEQADGPAVEYLSSLSDSSGAALKLLVVPVLAFRLARYIARFQVSAVMSHLFRANYVNVLARLLAGAAHRVFLVNHTRISRLSNEGIQGRINWILCRLLYPRADLVASVSVGAAIECARLLRLPGEKSMTLYDPVDLPVTRLGLRAPGKALHAIAAMGRFVALKRFSDLVLALSAVLPDFPHIELRFIGDGPDRKRIERLAADLGISGRVQFLGMLQKPSEVLADCDLFVSTSETEGFGMAIVEALAAALPVIASDCPYGPREILSPRTDPVKLLSQDSPIELAPFGVLYPVGNVKALEKALRQILSDSALRDELSRKGPSRAADFSSERSTAVYEKLLFA